MPLRKILWIMITGWIWASRLLGEESVLTLTASGLIVKPPHWEDASLAELTNLNFDFSGVASTSQPAKDVDSQVMRVKLVDAINYPANIELSRPKNCFIGSVQVDDQHVHFLYNDRILTSDSILQITSSSFSSYGLRFSKNGFYGDKFGLVRCLSPGSLTYMH
jgi:hypothetical protein